MQLRRRQQSIVIIGQLFGNQLSEQMTQALAHRLAFGTQRHQVAAANSHVLHGVANAIGQDCFQHSRQRIDIHALGLADVQQLPHDLLPKEGQRRQHAVPRQLEVIGVVRHQQQCPVTGEVVRLEGNQHRLGIVRAELVQQHRQSQNFRCGSFLHRSHGGKPLHLCQLGRQRSVWGLAAPLERNDPATIQLLNNFCRDVCGCTPWWSERVFIERAQAQIAEAAGDGEALCALSGGVDSGVTALLGQLALGQRLHCIFIDTGFLREDEADEVMEAYQNQLGMVVRRVDARAEFLLAIKGVTDPGEKERIIRSLLREVLRREAASFPNVKLLLRGTNYADEIDPADATSPIGGAMLEPVKELFKDEIRHVGESLGMPAAMTTRQPFPGSGLATRIMASVTAERLDILRTADAIFRKEIELAGLQKRLWQYYASMAVSPLPNGGLLVILRAVQASEGGAGLPARLPSDLLERVTADITRECPDVQRVFYDCTPSRSYAMQAGK